jgi:hypothetical protein
MKRLLIVLMGVSIAGPSLFGREQTVLARITVYWPVSGEKQCAASNGTSLHDGHCAVDPKKIPFGSKVIFPDATCMAVDSGPAVVSRLAARRCGKTPSQRDALVIDRYFETRRKAQAWVAAHPHFMTVRVVEPQRDTVKMAHRLATRPAADAQRSPRQTTMDACSTNPDQLPPDVRVPLSFFGGSLPRS